MDMYNEVKKLQDAMNRTGGRFKLSVLVQKRLKQIQLSSDATTPQPDLKDAMKNVLGEVGAGKIELVSEDIYRESLREAVSRSEKGKETEREKKRAAKEEK